MDWFTADYHLGHHNIIKYCNRPFKSTNEMDKVIINNLLDSAKAGDTLYFLGDLTFNRQIAKDFIVGLHMQKIKLVFIKGNHDKIISQGHVGQERIPGLDHVQNLKSLTTQGKTLVLCHYPMRRWDRSHYGSWNLHGHCHGVLSPKPNQYDVGVDNNSFCPVSLDMIRDKIILSGE